MTEQGYPPHYDRVSDPEMVAVNGGWLSGPSSFHSTSSSRKVPSSLMEDFGQYGTIAARHMARWQPSTYAAIPADRRESYFRELDEEVSQRIADRAHFLKPPRSLQETDFLAYVGQMNMARLMAEEEVLAELVYLPPEPGLESEAGEPEIAPNGGWIDRGWRDPNALVCETDEEWEDRMRAEDLEERQRAQDLEPTAQPVPKAAPSSQ
jgi:hypothetical protein